MPQDKAWKIFEAIEKYCKTSSGYTRIGNVNDIENVKPLNFEERLVTTLKLTIDRKLKKKQLFLC